MACSFNTHYTTSWFLVLLALLFVAIHTHKSHAILTNSSWSGGSTLQVPAHCRPEQAAALLQLKQSFSFTALSNSCPYISANTTLSSWREGTDCCLWEGVSCDYFSGSIIGIDLSSRSLGISGGLHPAIFSLTSLKHLNLDENLFCGSHLPAYGFERLTLLEDLSIADSNLSGPIPPSFSGLQSLKTINLRSNNFNGSTFPLGITHLKKLKVLDFGSMGLCGPIPSSIGNLTSLTTLYLRWNNFSGHVPSALRNLSRLEFVDLSVNKLEGARCTLIWLSRAPQSTTTQTVIMSVSTFQQGVKTIYVKNLAESVFSEKIKELTGQG